MVLSLVLAGKGGISGGWGVPGRPPSEEDGVVSLHTGMGQAERDPILSADTGQAASQKWRLL